MSWRAGHIDPVERAIERLNEVVRRHLGPSWSARVSIELKAAPNPAAVNDDLLNVEQTAIFLGKAHSTIRTMMQADEIPAAKIGGTWYVRRSALIELVPGRNAR